jgi:lipid-A-disaccharide synthase
LLQDRLGPFRVVIPTVETVGTTVAEGVARWPGKPIVVTGESDKYGAFAASRAALAASGSVALELALARLPMAVAYRVNPMTEALLRRVLKVRHASLVNLVLDRPLVPELLGRDCTPERLAAAVAGLAMDEAVRAVQQQGYDEAIARLRAGVACPSFSAADRVLDILSQRNARSRPDA